MTYAELGQRMSSTEFELRLALEIQRSNECQNCGVEPMELMEYEMVTMKCPVCKHESGRVRKWEDLISLKYKGEVKDS